MEKLSKVNKVLFYFTVLFFVIWLGGYISRQLVVYQLFNANDLTLKSIFDAFNLVPTLYVISPILTINMVTYISFLAFFILFLLASKINLRREGWLFISLMIVIITAPFEIFLLTYDYSVIAGVLTENFDSFKLAGILKERIVVLSSFSLVEIFCYFG
ncbi:MAG: hypothetical protein RBS48_08360, partial [Ignavibacteriaceae bacterium]|nr:hypothetical protein [Ignavibacteriaceae bacterium]